MAINTIIFDLGNVLVHWNPMFVYENYFESDESGNISFGISVRLGVE